MTDSPAVYETKYQAVKSSGSEVSAWLQAIEAQKNDKKYKKWLENGREVSSLYVNEGEKKQRFNILYSNTQTMAPAIYNSAPQPDIRERHGEQDDGRVVAQVLERAVDYSIDNYDMHQTLQDVVLDAMLVGRGVPRVRYEPEMGEELGLDGLPYPVIKFQKTFCELVDWDSIIVGPAKRWKNVPWVAFEHLMTREQLRLLSPEVADKIPMDEIVNGADDKSVSEAPSIFKRALIYEVWDKETGTVLFICPKYRDEVLQQGKPEINLSGFFPVPRPLYAAKRTDSLLPTIPYCMYEDQAKELDLITKRISSLTKCLKWRGVYTKGFSAFGEIEKADDGEFIPTEQDFSVMSGMGLDKAVLFMPIAELIGVIKELYQQREQVKQTIYEITGISDILRGSSKATETLGAQQLKAQWGSLRISDIQEDVQRMARDLIRMMCEIIAENFDQNVISAITNIQLDENTMNILRSDLARRFKVDIETDSTIRADLTRSQQNVSQFVQGFGSFIQSVGPAVQQGAMPKETAVELLLSFARNFKLGRQAEAALEKMKEPQPQSQPQSGGEQAQQQEIMMQQQAEAQKMQLEKYKIDQDNQTKLQIAQIQAQNDYQIAIIQTQQQRPFVA